MCRCSLDRIIVGLVVVLPLFGLQDSVAFSNNNNNNNNMMDVANFAVQQSPSSTRLITNKMCPYAQKAWIALEAIGAPYEMHELSLYGPGGKPDWFWNLNPAGTVPVLTCHGGAVIMTDSDTILDNLPTAAVAAVGGGTTKLVPSSPQAVATADQFRAVLKEFLPIGKRAVLGGRQDEKIEMWKKLQELDVLIEGPFVCGDQLTIADCAGFPFLWRIQDEFGSLSMERQGCGNISKWLQTCLAQDAFSKTIQKSWWWWW